MFERYYIYICIHTHTYILQANVDERLKGRLAEVFRDVYTLADKDGIDAEELRLLTERARSLVNIGKM
jgi:hypothetical protein